MLTQRRFGELVERCVLYLGENLDAANGIVYRNAESFLETLPQFTLRADVTQAMDFEQDGSPEFHLTM